MRNILKNYLYLSLAALVLVIPMLASAQTPPGLFETAFYAGLPIGQTDPIGSVARIVNIFLGFLGALAVVLMIVAGFKWMTSAGNENQISEAKALLRNATIGMAIVLTAFIVTLFTVNALRWASGSNEGAPCVGFGQQCGPNTPTNAQCCPGFVCPNVGVGLPAICQYPNP